MKSMVKFGFLFSKADPCFMFHKNDKGICIILIDVDDNFLVGDDAGLNKAIEQIQSTFSIKIQENNLGNEFIVSHDNKKRWLGQPNH